MENEIAEDFLRGFSDGRYPDEFVVRYEAMECLSSRQNSETLLVREKADGRLLIAKCYEKGHPLFESTEPKELRALRHPGIPAFVEELYGTEMGCILG
jgi:hypothetical protein